MMQERTVAHYQILEKIGEGGMGVVYRARDTRLERDVALKFLSLDFTGSQELKQRFIQEAQAASALDHPNICTIHAIEETDDGQLFIAMGYYEGETVKTKLKQGPIRWQEIVDMAVQIAAGLQAAHERGIIHMDVKPANLMVTADGTVKILDFGLSRFTTEVDRTRPQGPLMGTIAYMAPERVQGEKTGAECDVWALGVVLYEMATGARPFQGNNDMSLLYSIVHREAPAPIEKVPEMSEELDRIIRRCLVKDRRHRFRSLAELLAELEALQQASQILTAPLGWAARRDLDRRRARRRFAAAATGLALALVLVLAWSAYVGETNDPERVGLVSAGFENRTGDAAADWHGTALSELLVVELPEDGRLRWLPEDDAEPAAPDSEHSFDSEKGLPDVVLAQLRQRLHADWVVDGAYRTVGDAGARRLELEVLLQDTRSGKGIGYPPLTGRSTELLEMAGEMAGRMAASLGYEPLERSVEEVAALPAHPEAARLLREAVERLRQLDAPAARDLLQRATAFERRPNALLHAYLADALWMLGLEDEAKQEIARAVTEGRGLPRTTQVYLRAVSLERQAKRTRAAALLRALWVRERGAADENAAGSLPARADLGLRLAELLAWTFQEEAARTTLAALGEQLPADPRVPLVEGLIEHNRGSRQREQEAFARGARLARQQDAPLLLARALAFEAQAWQWQGALEETEARLRESREIYRAHGHVRGEADTMTVYGNLYLARHDLQAAKEMFAEAVRLLDTIGARRLKARTLTNMGEALSINGDLVAAIRIFHQALELLEELGDRVARQVSLRQLAEALTELGRFDEAESAYAAAFEILESVPEPGNESATLSSHGWLLILRGDLGGASRSLEEALKIQTETGDELNRSWTVFRRARILHYQGSLGGALRGYEEAMGVFRQDGGDTLVAMVQAAQGETLMSQGHLEAAGRSFRAALAIQDTLINPLPAAKTRLSMAALLHELGRPAEAEAAADHVLTDLAQTPVLEVSRAHVLRARSLLLQGRLDAAQQAISQARQALGEVDSPIYRLPLELTAARLAAVRGEEVRQTLQSHLATAAAGVFTELRLEIELALGEVEIRSGSLRGFNRLRDLGREAENRGYGLIARQVRTRLAAAADRR
jgi:tetratricopeptide (TPR) repeat protein